MNNNYHNMLFLFSFLLLIFCKKNILKGKASPIAVQEHETTAKKKRKSERFKKQTLNKDSPQSSINTSPTVFPEIEKIWNGNQSQHLLASP